MNLHKQTFSEALFADVPEREMVLYPVIKTGELIMIFAPTGLGKSHLALGMAHSIATGQDFLGYKCGAARSVLYVEAEMGQQTVKSRLTQIEAGSAVSCDPMRFSIISRHPQTNYLPNLGTEDGQAVYRPHFMAADVIIVDNYNSAASLIDRRDDEFKMWERIKPFVFELRNVGKTFILIHHTNKSSDLPSGTVKKDEAQDTIVRLTKPYRRSDPKKLAFCMTYTKDRNLEPDQGKGLYVEFWVENGGTRWAHRDLKQYINENIRELSRTIKNKETLARIFHVSLFDVHEALKEPEPTKFRDDIDPFNDGGENDL